MTEEEELREIARSSYAAQMDMLGYQTDGNPKDMVEVVRCKNCKNAEPAFDGKMARCKIRGLRKNDWFCADGKRR